MSLPGGSSASLVMAELDRIAVPVFDVDGCGRSPSSGTLSRSLTDDRDPSPPEVVGQLVHVGWFYDKAVVIEVSPAVSHRLLLRPREKVNDCGAVNTSTGKGHLSRSILVYSIRCHPQYTGIELDGPLHILDSEHDVVNIGYLGFHVTRPILRCFSRATPAPRIPVSDPRGRLLLSLVDLNSVANALHHVHAAFAIDPDGGEPPETRLDAGSLVAVFVVFRR